MLQDLLLKPRCFSAQTVHTPKVDHSLKSFLGDSPELSTPRTAEAQTQGYFPEEVELSEAIKVGIQEKKVCDSMERKEN